MHYVRAFDIILYFVLYYLPYQGESAQATLLFTMVWIKILVSFTFLSYKVQFIEGLDSPWLFAIPGKTPRIPCYLIHS